MNWNFIIQNIQLGFTHVIPLGFDHILFILSLYLANPKFKNILMQCSVFTIAHSMSLALASLGIIKINAQLIEILIAMSIVYTSIENIISSKTKQKLINWRILIIFIFGLVHGLGFANALLELDGDKSNFVLSLLSFNLGVEIGQIAIILLSYYLSIKWICKYDWYYMHFVKIISSIIACIAMYWFVQRLIL